VPTALEPIGFVLVVLKSVRMPTVWVSTALAVNVGAPVVLMLNALAVVGSGLVAQMVHSA
jgi:hypothetical protein